MVQYNIPLGDEFDRHRVLRVERLWMQIGLGLFLMGGAVISTVINFWSNGGKSAVPTVIPVPAWPFWIVSVGPLVFIVATWNLLDSRHKELLWITLSYVFLFYICLPFALSGAYPSESGLPFAGKTLGWHWLAIPIEFVAAIMIIIKIIFVPKSEVRATPRREGKFNMKTRTDRNLFYAEIDRQYKLMNAPGGMEKYMDELRLESVQHEKEEAAEVDGTRQDPNPRD